MKVDTIPTIRYDTIFFDQVSKKYSYIPNTSLISPDVLQ